jgi:hypothetical protein
MQRPQVSDIWQYQDRVKYLVVMVLDHEDPDGESVATYPWIADIIAIDGRNKGTLYKGYSWPIYGAWRKVE